VAQAYDDAVRDGRLKRDRRVGVIELYAVAQGLADCLCLVCRYYPAGAPVSYAVAVVYCGKVAPERQVAIFKVDVAAYRLYDSPADVAAVPKAVSKHVKDGNV
jgi:hypothetical protein